MPSYTVRAVRDDGTLRDPVSLEANSPLEAAQLVTGIELIKAQAGYRATLRAKVYVPREGIVTLLRYYTRDMPV